MDEYNQKIDRIDRLVTSLRLFKEGTVSCSEIYTRPALTTQLRVALIFVSDSNTSNDFISCAIMDRFGTSVNTLATRGLLTDAQATDLLQQTQEVKNIIGCASAT